jgi:hypothetical protein
MRSIVTRVCSLAIVLTTIISSPTASPQALGEPEQPDMRLGTEAKIEVIDSLVKDLTEFYVFSDLGNKITKAVEESQERGEYKSITSAKEFRELVTQQMYEIPHDKYLCLIYSSEVVPPMPIQRPGAEPQLDPRALLRLRKDNYAFEEARHLNGNIGYLKLNRFTDPERGGSTVSGAMAFIANTDALNINLRENTGGGPSIVELKCYRVSAKRKSVLGKDA